MSITLAALAGRLPGAQVRGDATLVDATHDSRHAGPATLFCAIRGARSDGHDHAAAAVAAGAAALLVERFLDLDVPQIRVPDSRAATGPAAAVIHGDPSQSVDVIGVTGTNGKTTTCYLIEAGVAAAGRGAGVIGTIETRLHGRAVPGVRTTPEGTDLQRLLRHLVDGGVDVAAMEVSSHGLVLQRVAGTQFAAVVFTNLSQDHLDFHADMDDYHAAKAMLFRPEFSDRGIVCIDDQWGRRLAADAPIQIVTYGQADDADWQVLDIDASPFGTSFVLRGPGDIEVSLATRLPGWVNAMNASAAWLACTAVGIDGNDAARGIADCPGVPGRLERVHDPRGELTVLVDYAHTPVAVERVVGIAAELTSGRTIVVLGCGGDRDVAKRGPMGAAVAAADVAVLTSDNPRSEDPEAILDALEAGARAAVAHGARAEVMREVDRTAAITRAIAVALPGDVVVIAGKGHETGQTTGDTTVEFDDRVVAAAVLAARAEVAQ